NETGPRQARPVSFVTSQPGYGDYSTPSPRVQYDDLPALRCGFPPHFELTVVDAGWKRLARRVPTIPVRDLPPRFGIGEVDDRLTSPPPFHVRSDRYRDQLPEHVVDPHGNNRGILVREECAVEWERNVRLRADRSRIVLLELERSHALRRR